MYNGNGFQLQQQLGGTNLAMQAWGNARQNNIFTDANNLIGNLQYNNAQRALLDSANPYDGLTVYQKLQQLGLGNNYVLNNLGKLENAYNTETTNIVNARQAASDFKTEPLLAEAIAAKASGDPRRVQAFNSQLDKTISAWVASGAMTPETARKLYIDFNAVAQERANLGLTNAQARQANAGAHINELRANDMIMNQQSLADFKYLISKGIVTDVNSALDVGAQLGWDTGRTMAAFNAGKIAEYSNQYGGVLNQLGDANLSPYVGSLGFINKANMPIGGGSAGGAVASGASPTVTGSPTAAQPQAATQNGTVMDAANQVVPQGQAVPTQGTSGLPNEPVAQSGINPALNNSETNAQAAPAANGTATPTAAAATQNLQQAAATQNQQNSQVAADKLNQAAEQATKDSGGAVIKSNNGNNYIDLGKNAVFNNKTGTWEVNSNVPLDQTSKYDFTVADKNLQDLDRQLGGNLKRIVQFSQDQNGNPIFTPTEFIKGAMQKDPTLAEKYKAVESNLYKILEPLYKGENLAAGLYYTQSAFGTTPELREIGTNNLDELFKHSNNNAVSGAANDTIRSQYSLGGAPQSISNLNKDVITPILNLFNAANTANDRSTAMTQTLASNPSAIAASTSSAIDTANSYIKTGIAADINNREARLNNIKEIDELSNLVSNSSISSLLSSDNAVAQKEVKTLMDNGVIVRVKNPDKQDAEGTEAIIDLSDETTGEYLTATEALANLINTKYNLPINIARAIAFKAGTVANRTVVNALVPAISGTNNPQYLNVEEAFKSAALAKTYLLTPEGRDLYNQATASLEDAKLALQEFNTASAALKDQTAIFSNISKTAKDGGFAVRTIKGKDGKASYELLPSNARAYNDLRYNGATSQAIMQTVNDFSSAATTYEAAYNNLIYAARPVSESRLVEDVSGEFNNNKHGFTFLSSSSAPLSGNQEDISFFNTTPYASLYNTASYSFNPPTNNVVSSLKDYKGASQTFTSNDLIGNSTSTTPTNTNAPSPTTNSNIDFSNLKVEDMKDNASAMYIAGEDLANKGDIYGAIPYWEKAAAQGVPEAQYQLGKLLLDRETTPSYYDYEKGVDLLSKASAQGHSGAAKELENYKQTNSNNTPLVTAQSLIQDTPSNSLKSDIPKQPSNMPKQQEDIIKQPSNTPKQQTDASDASIINQLRDTYSSLSPEVQARIDKLDPVEAHDLLLNRKELNNVIAQESRIQAINSSLQSWKNTGKAIKNFTENTGKVMTESNKAQVSGMGKIGNSIINTGKNLTEGSGKIMTESSKIQESGTIGLRNSIINKGKAASTLTGNTLKEANDLYSTGMADVPSKFGDAAMYLLTGTDKQQREAMQKQFDTTLKKAESGNVTSQYLISNAYMRKGDKAKGEYWMAKAAANGYPNGYVELARQFNKGKGGYDQNSEKALYYYGKALSEFGPLSAIGREATQEIHNLSEKLNKEEDTVLAFGKEPKYNANRIISDAEANYNLKKDNLLAQGKSTYWEDAKELSTKDIDNIVSTEYNSIMSELNAISAKRANTNTQSNINTASPDFNALTSKDVFTPEDLISHSTSKPIKQESTYNKATTLIKQGKYDEGINAFKQIALTDSNAAQSLASIYKEGTIVKQDLKLAAAYMKLAMQLEGNNSALAREYANIVEDIRRNALKGIF